MECGAFDYLFNHENMSRVFLSHTSIDKPFVRKLANDLRIYGHTVWIDEAEIKIGDSLIDKISQGIDEVDYVAVVLSNNSIESQWVNQELKIAINREIAEKKKVVLPLLIENVSIPAFLRDKRYGDFSTPEIYQKSLNDLLEALGTEEQVLSNTNNDIDKLKEDAQIAKEAIEKHATKFAKATEHILKTKSPSLQEAVSEDNRKWPIHAPINNVYAFEVLGQPITLGYLFHVLNDIKVKGSHQLELGLELDEKWGEAKRMIDAYVDMIDEN